MEFFPELKKLLGHRLERTKEASRRAKKTPSLSAARGRHLLCLLSSVILLQRPTTLELKRILSRGSLEEKEVGKLRLST